MTGPATRSMTIPSLGWTVFGDFLRVIKPLVIFEILFKLAATGLGMLVGLGGAPAPHQVRSAPRR